MTFLLMKAFNTGYSSNFKYRTSPEHKNTFNRDGIVSKYLPPEERARRLLGSIGYTPHGIHQAHSQELPLPLDWLEAHS